MSISGGTVTLTGARRDKRLLRAINVLDSICACGCQTLLGRRRNCDLLPHLDMARPLGLIEGGWQTMTLRADMTGDAAEGREETLCMPGRLELLDGAFFLASWLV